MPDPIPDELWTIGHWTCPPETFLGTLDGANIEQIVDVRAQPGSRRSPQFGPEALPAMLAGNGIGYLHLAELGGRRRLQHIDPEINGGWENRSFHNYADYTLTPRFAAGLDRLVAIAREKRTCLLCGEPMPWRCHRSLISTVLVARGWTVWHLSTTSAPRRHELGGWGATPQVEGGVVTYPASAQG